MPSLQLMSPAFWIVTLIWGLTSLKCAALSSSRSLNYSAWRIGLFTNPWAFAGVAVMVILQMLFTYLPQANFIFKSAPIGWADWAKILGFAVLVYVLVEIEKALRQRRKQKTA